MAQFHATLNIKKPFNLKQIDMQHQGLIHFSKALIIFFSKIVFFHFFQDNLRFFVFSIHSSYLPHYLIDFANTNQIKVQAHQMTNN